MAEPHEHGFLSLNDVRPPFHSDEGNGPSPFDTLWTEFARSHPRLSPPRTPTHRVVRSVASAGSSVLRVRSAIDLRSLDYVSEYDSNLMCPICHVPLIDPVVLDCDHTFCQQCFEEYKNGGPSTDRSKCPACRSYLLGGSRKASRLIKNMCNEIQVRCPNNRCDVVTARGYVEQHATRECPEQELPCPDTQCLRKSKRKNFVPDQCIHSSHIECDCGASMQLGRGEWIKHKDLECPNKNSVPTASLETTVGGQEDEAETPPRCPGADFGCTEEIALIDHETHIKHCPLARLAPALTKQSQLLHSLSVQLKMTNLRNDVLETGFDRLNELITNTIEPKLNRLIDTDHSSDIDIEEIPRDDLSLLSTDTPTPTATQTTSYTTAYNSLHPRLSTLESQTSTLQSHLTDLDARSSMALMNETLRIREELAHINGAMYSTRAQVQWLLNRERIMGQREAMGQRGRVGAPGGGSAQTQAQGQGQGQGARAERGGPAQNSQSAAGVAGGTSTQRPSIDRNLSSAWSTISQAAAGSGSGPSSAATSPMFSAARPSLRRLSGGSSQERVKL
ncbi:hypothetical protein LTR70_004220 [Exophiala xenobiotica]|uniref:Uncharacterized protein n=1 Tax=Lithohypha guttulata TaxID=1690604 RepID=A0ABR0KE92_9EURO|nr:hypothetical protein LTR24_003702 [Lithohypha guttulata]KAK5321507.1 hypothetical protein LTR70_004220 [Exophiala xenobiotica]